MEELDIMLFETQDAWEAWLDSNHEHSDGVRLQIAKKASGQRSVSYAEALESALCFGWIDSKKQAHDDHYWLQRFTPRRTKSVWSAINREKAETLIQQGRMRDAGLREVERAKDDGRWDAAYPSQSQATVPPDLQAALDADEKARAFFETLNSTNRYAIIYRVTSAKKSDTRQRRIAQFVQMLADGKKIYD